MIGGGGGRLQSRCHLVEAGGLGGIRPLLQLPLGALCGYIYPCNGLAAACWECHAFVEVEK